MSIAHNTPESLEVLLAQTIGERLEKSLRVMNISAQDMAEYLGVSRTTISNWIHGRAPIKRGSLVAWSLRTGVPLQWFESGVLPHDNKKTPTRKGEGRIVGPAGFDPTTSTVIYGTKATLTSLNDYRERKAS